MIFQRSLFSPVFQKALLHSVLITILNHPHNHHHKNILILRVQKPLINRAEINSVLFSFTDFRSEKRKLWHTSEFRGPVCFLINVEISKISPFTQSQNLITQLIKNHPSMSTEAFPSALVMFLNCPADFRVTRGQETLGCNQRSKICPGTLRMRG